MGAYGDFGDRGDLEVGDNFVLSLGERGDYLGLRLSSLSSLDIACLPYERRMSSVELPVQTGWFFHIGA